MRFAHVVKVTPGQCGLYETASELAQGLQTLGHDAYLLDPDDAKGGIEADFIVSHSGLDGLDIGSTPVIHAQHGRPRSSFLIERTGGPAVYKYQRRWSKRPQSIAVITFWPEHVPFLRHLWGDVPVFDIPACVDTDKWKRRHAHYKFMGKRGDFNAVIADPWRADSDPYWSIHAFMEFAERYKGDARLHIYGLPKDRLGIDTLLNMLHDRGCLGELRGWVTSGLDIVYSNADVCLSCNAISTRSCREAAACGCPVIEVGTDPVIGALKIENKKYRNVPVVRPADAAERFLGVLQEVMLTV